MIEFHAFFSRLSHPIRICCGFGILWMFGCFGIVDTYAQIPTTKPTSQASPRRHSLPPAHQAASRPAQQAPVRLVQQANLHEAPKKKPTTKPVVSENKNKHMLQFRHGDWLPELPPASPPNRPSFPPNHRPFQRSLSPYPAVPSKRPDLRRDPRRLRFDRGGRRGRGVYRRYGFAQESDAQLLQRYRVDLVTIGPGNWLFTYFGHNSLRVRDRLLGNDLTYNFGTFSGNNPIQLLRDYLRNQMKYWLSIIPHNYLLRGYQYTDRTYTYRTLHLRAKELRRLLQFLQHHARPENRFYKYDHYRQNCSTKLRDALHYAMGPVFREDALMVGKQTYRKHVMQRTSPNPFLMVAMDFGMGPFADRPLRRWDDMFLPVHLEAYVADPKWAITRGNALASSSVTLYKRRGAEAIRVEPVSLTYGVGGFWFLLGLLLWARPSFRRWLRFTLFVAASLGTALAFMMFFTWMPEPPRNANLLMYHPLHWLPFLLLAKKRWELPSTRRVLGFYLIAHAWLGMLYLILKPIWRLPIQMNTHHYAVAIVLFGLAAFRLYYGPAPASSASSASVTSV